MNKKNLEKTILESISKAISSELQESEDLDMIEVSAPVNADIKDPYIIEAPYMKKSSAYELEKFNDVKIIWAKSSTRFICSKNSVADVVETLVNMGVLECSYANPSLNKLVIYKASDGKFMNDSLVENQINEGKVGSYTKEAGKVARQKLMAELAIVKLLKTGEIERDEEDIKSRLLESGLFDDSTEKQIIAAVKFILKKSEGFVTDEKVEGDFLTDFVYSPEDAREVNEADAIKDHIDYLIKNGLTVELEKRRYSTRLCIHYSTAYQLDCLINWTMWHLGYSETIMGGRSSNPDREEVKGIIASGKSCVW